MICLQLGPAHQADNDVLLTDLESVAKPVPVNRSGFVGDHQLN